jgi:HD-like signal output (HDOD) protein
MLESILIIDDEAQILRLFQRVFMGSPYTVHYRESANEALDFLSRHSVDIIITDVRMPVMDGLELLRIVKEKYPKILRVVLSGYTDMKLVFNALEENLAKTYWIKPWNNDDFMLSIQKLSEMNDLFDKKDIVEFFNNMSDLPTLPSMYLTISKMIRADEGVDKISKIIEKDPAIASKLLRIANSAFFGTHTGSIHQAIMFIGLSNIKNLILSHAVFTSSAMQSGIFKHLWSHASRTNTIASIIYVEFMGRKIPQIYASAGLLHSIGLVVLWMRYGASYIDLIVKDNHSDQRVSEIERESFNLTHEELGAYLLNWWDIPLPVVEAALYHHNPSAENIINKELVCVIHLAHYYAWESLDEAFFKEPLDLSVFEELNISKEHLEERVKSINFANAD